MRRRISSSAFPMAVDSWQRVTVSDCLTFILKQANAKEDQWTLLWWRGSLSVDHLLEVFDLHALLSVSEEKDYRTLRKVQSFDHLILTESVGEQKDPHTLSAHELYY